MKKLLSCMLLVALLFSLTITASAESFTDDENLSTVLTTDEKVENTEPDTTMTLGSETPEQVVVVPDESALPEGYVVDPHFSKKITLDAKNGWSYSLKDLLDEADSDEYIYFIVEEDVPEGYTPSYSLNSTDVTNGGNVIIVKNVKKEEPPIYELPESGGIGTTPYTVAGVAILLIAAVYCIILHHKRKKAHNNSYMN